MNIKTTAFGFPRIGANRELKKVLEDYWNRRISQSELMSVADTIVLNNARTIHEYEVDLVPSNDFSIYDFILDHSLMFDVIPERFNIISDPLEKYFAIARGTDTLIASEMTKWFNTNYHYIVPEIERDSFFLREIKPLKEYWLIKERLNIKSKPVLVGPYTYLKCAKVGDERVKQLMEKLITVYKELFQELEKAGVEEVQLDEPAFVNDLDEENVNVIINCYNTLKAELNLKLYIQTYYDSLSEYEKIVYSLPVHGFGFDLVDGRENIENILKFGYPKDKVLIAGIISGRDPWKTNLEEAVRTIDKLSKITEQLILSNSCPLMHLPITVENEKNHLPKDIYEMFSFAKERIAELSMLKGIINEGIEVPTQKLSFHENFTNPSVREKIKQINETKLQREPDFKERYRKQIEMLKLPLFPTTTIGSFPQTKEIRKIRADYKSGRITEEEYRVAINIEIEKAIRVQEEIGIDVLVHGEFERTDMVEFFAERLNGFAVTKNGWVQSYGSRCVRPPIIFGDVSRKEPLIQRETLYAQSLTERPVKAIFTGPVTMLQWSYPRKDISRKEISYQIALALKEEFIELEEKGIKIIQIDEPAFREGLPIKRAKHDEYFEWAINSFKVITKDAKPETQIHTHMCYSDFNEIIDKIYALDADVISIEASRSKGEIISAFEKFKYDHGIGIGVYDIHSPRIPSVEEMLEIVRRSLKLIDKSLFWINPDCGLKTRGWQETIPSLKNMLKISEILRMEV